jgi:hypothetical protein
MCCDAQLWILFTILLFLVLSKAWHAGLRGVDAATHTVLVHAC